MQRTQRLCFNENHSMSDVKAHNTTTTHTHSPSFLSFFPERTVSFKLCLFLMSLPSLLISPYSPYVSLFGLSLSHSHTLLSCLYRALSFSLRVLLFPLYFSSPLLDHFSSPLLPELVPASWCQRWCQSWCQSWCESWCQSWC